MISVRKYLLIEDTVLFNQAASTMGEANLRLLAEEYATKGEFLAAARAKYAVQLLGIAGTGTQYTDLLTEAYSLLEQISEPNRNDIRTHDFKS